MSEKSAMRIFFEGLGIYCRNFHKFTGYMLFPVFGQLIGLGLIFGLTFWFANNLPQLIEKYPALNDVTTMALCIMFIVIPGMLIFVKAFWDYLVAYGALNSMTHSALETGRVYDFKAHRGTVTNKFWTFLGLLFLLTIFLMLASFPLFWVPGTVLAVYYVLIFQVFTFEENVTPIGCFKSSFELVRGNFGPTLALMLILLIFCYWILPLGASVLISDVKLAWLINWADKLPLDELYLSLQKVNLILTPEIIASFILNITVSSIVIGMTLPLRSICCTLWYKTLVVPVQPEQPKRRRKKEVEEQ